MVSPELSKARWVGRAWSQQPCQAKSCLWSDGRRVPMLRRMERTGCRQTSNARQRQRGQRTYPCLVGAIGYCLLGATGATGYCLLGATGTTGATACLLGATGTGYCLLGATGTGYCLLGATGTGYCLLGATGHRTIACLLGIWPVWATASDTRKIPSAGAAAKIKNRIDISSTSNVDNESHRLIAWRQSQTMRRAAETVYLRKRRWLLKIEEIGNLGNFYKEIRCHARLFCSHMPHAALRVLTVYMRSDLSSGSRCRR